MMVMHGGMLTILIFMLLLLQLCGDHGHGAVLGAYVCTNLKSCFVGLLHGFAVDDRCAERTSERVACSYGIGYLYLRRVLE